MMIADSLEAFLLTLGELNPHQVAVVTLARMVAAELDESGVGNAALVKQYRDLLGGLVVDDDSSDPIGDVLARILDASSDRAAESR